MIYFQAKDVISPQRNLKNPIPLFQNNDFAVAKVTWDGVDRIAIRWNVTQNEWNNPDKKNLNVKCVGEPNSRGYPTWFILPELFLSLLITGNQLTDGNQLSEDILKTLNRIQK